MKLEKSGAKKERKKERIIPKTIAFTYVYR